MAAKRLSMRKVRDILRLKWGEKRSHREVKRALGVSVGKITDCVKRATRAGLSWPLEQELDDASLEQLLYGDASSTNSGKKAPPDCAWIHRELRRKEVTLQLLWQEYKEAHPEDGYQYTQFCEHYRRFRSKVNVTLRHEHRAGEKMFVDFSGQGIEITNPLDGTKTIAELFVAVLGASNYTYAEAVPSQKLPDWISAHAHAYEFFGGVPEITIIDNLKSGVTRPCRYEPEVNSTYLDMARHYETTIIPARPRKPKDKAKAEAGVLLVQRWILASLRNEIFFSIQEANRAIREKLHLLNNRKLQKLNATRHELFESIDRPALRRLPAKRYEFAEWARARVNIDYHVEVDRRYYSVPYQLAKETVEVRKTHSTIEILFKGKRVASHARSSSRGAYSTLTEHMPKSHRKHLEWTPSRLMAWAAKTGSATALVVERILESRPHPEQGYRSCLGLLRLGRKYSNERLEAACRRAVAVGACSYKSVNSILQTGLDKQPLARDVAAKCLADHDNVRGPQSYS